MAHRVNGGHKAASAPPPQPPPKPSIPQHVAFVCDGNSRWARQRGLPVVAGHAAGADRLVDVVLPALRERGVRYCTMYGFSTENWKRSDKEIAEIFSVMEHTATRVTQRLVSQKERGVRIRILGDLQDERITDSLRAALYKLQLETKRLCEGEVEEEESPGGGEAKPLVHTLCLCVNYGGRQDILQAAKKLAQAVEAGKISNINQFSEDDFSRLLCTEEVPDPDLIIRTSGECRLSNFLLWNAAYSEFYFTDTLWPDFDDTAMGEALQWYALRKRRFGSRQEV